MPSWQMKPGTASLIQRNAERRCAMAIDVRGHTVPAAGEGIDFNAINTLSASINAVKTVANMTEAAQYITALQAASLPTAGVTIFNTSDNKYYGWVGARWKAFSLDAPTVLTGTVSVAGINNGASQAIPITFPAGLFASEPRVSATPANGRLNPGISAKSINGFTLNLFNWSGGSAGATTTDWIAML